jgi:hypothetical protein
VVLDAMDRPVGGASLCLSRFFSLGISDNVCCLSSEKTDNSSLCGCCSLLLGCDDTVVCYPLLPDASTAAIDFSIFLASAHAF